MTNLSSVGRTDSEKDRRTRNSDCLDHGGQRRDPGHQSSAGGFRSLANGPSLWCAFLYPCPATGDSRCLRSCSDDQAKRDGRRSPHPLGTSAAGIKISHRAREKIIGFSFLRESKVLGTQVDVLPKSASAASTVPFGKIRTSKRKRFSYPPHRTSTRKL